MLEQAEKQRAPAEKHKASAEKQLQLAEKQRVPAEKQLPPAEEQLAPALKKPTPVQLSNDKKIALKTVQNLRITITNKVKPQMFEYMKDIYYY